MILTPNPNTDLPNFKQLFCSAYLVYVFLKFNENLPIIFDVTLLTSTQTAVRTVPAATNGGGRYLVTLQHAAAERCRDLICTRCNCNLGGIIIPSRVT